MPNSKDSAGLQIIDPVLTNLALQYRSEGFIYDQVVSSMAVAKRTGQYPVWSIDDFMRSDVEAAVDDRAVTPEIDFTYSLAPYALENYRLKTSIAPGERSQAHEALRLEQSKMNGLLDRMAILRELRLAAALRKTTNSGQLTLGSTPSTKWDAASGATIEQDIKTAKLAVWNATGQMVDTIVMSLEVAYAVAVEPTIREILKYTVNGQQIIRAGDAILPAQIHGLNVVVSTAKYNTAKEGAAKSLSSIWGDHVRLVKRAPTNAWGSPATVYAIRGPVREQTPGHLLIDRYEQNDPPVEFVRVWECVQEKIVAPDVAYELSDVLT